MKKIRKQEDGMFWYLGQPIRKTRDTTYQKLNNLFNKTLEELKRFIKKNESKSKEN